MKIKKTFQKLTISKTLTLPIIAGVLLFSFSAFYYFRILSSHRSQPSLISAPVVQNSKPKDNKISTSTPSLTEKPLPTLKAENTPIPAKQWKFSNKEYDVSVTDISYRGVKDLNCSKDDSSCQAEDLKNRLAGYRVEASLSIKNISVTPFLTDYQISDCEIVKNGNLTRFTSAQGGSFQKGILPGESLQIKIDSRFYGNDFDVAGNKINPSSDLRIKTCKIQFKTPGEKQGVSLHKVTETAPEEQWLVEPQTIQLSN